MVCRIFFLRAISAGFSKCIKMAAPTHKQTITMRTMIATYLHSIFECRQYRCLRFFLACYFKRFAKASSHSPKRLVVLAIPTSHISRVFLTQVRKTFPYAHKLVVGRGGPINFFAVVKAPVVVQKFANQMREPLKVRFVAHASLVSWLAENKTSI